MKLAKQRRPEKGKNTTEQSEKMAKFTSISAIFLFLIFGSAFYLGISYTPLSKDEQIERYNKMNEDVEPFRKNLTECARQVRASMVDVENFLKRVPQTSMQGKCFVACILKRNSIIKNNKIERNNLLEANKQFYSENSEVMERLEAAVEECTGVVEGVFEICEYASMFNDCMHIRMEHILDKVTIERRMEALGQMSKDPDVWTEEEDELLQLFRDEL